MEEVVLKLQNLPKQLCLLVSIPPAAGCHSMSNHTTTAYLTDPPPGKIPEVVCISNSLNGIIVAECMELQ